MQRQDEPKIMPYTYRVSFFGRGACSRIRIASGGARSKPVSIGERDDDLLHFSVRPLLYYLDELAPDFASLTAVVPAWDYIGSYAKGCVADAGARQLGRYQRYGRRRHTGRRASGLEECAPARWTVQSLLQNRNWGSDPVRSDEWVTDYQQASRGASSRHGREATSSRVMGVGSELVRA